MKKLLLSLGAIASVAAPVAAVVACGSNPLQDPAKELVINEAKTNNVVAALNGFRTFKVGEDTYTLVDDDPTKFSEVVTKAWDGGFEFIEGDTSLHQGLNYNYDAIESLLKLKIVKGKGLDMVKDYQFNLFPSYVKRALISEATKLKDIIVKAPGAPQKAALDDYNKSNSGSPVVKLDVKETIKFNKGFDIAIGYLKN